MTRGPADDDPPSAGRGWPVLWYEDIYFEAVQALLRRGDRQALVRQMECIAEGLSDPESPNLAAAMRDLALVHLELGDHREGLSLFAALHRQDPSDPWTYNSLALNLPRLGFPSLGKLAAERGLELVRRGEDRERLSQQLGNLLRKMGTAEDRSDGPKDAVADLGDALHTPLEAKRAESCRELALRLVPELATARVKQLPRMPTADVLRGIGDRLLPFLRAGSTSAMPSPARHELAPARTVLRPETSQRLRGLAGFRNVLVHDYADGDLAIVAHGVQRLGDFIAFVGDVETWLQATGR